MEPDILAALFRPPPPPRGRLTTPKMKLHRLKLRDVAFQQKGIAATTKSIDPSELRDLDFTTAKRTRDHKSEEADLLNSELALLHLAVEAELLQPLQHLPNVLVILLLIL
ncbi:hypothetical protein BDD12DRAFT_910910 [Trichophaea hybrida]|nr:hypothetical protein BDD12DRAFT_910910 [Trichophaea hybrida]